MGRSRLRAAAGAGRLQHELPLAGVGLAGGIVAVVTWKAFRAAVRRCRRRVRGPGGRDAGLPVLPRLSPARPLIRGGVLLDGHRHELDHALVREHTRFSWFNDVGPQHPWQTVIKPDRSRAESYSWATAPRYGDDDRVMQLGPLPELLIAGDPLATAS